MSVIILIEHGNHPERHFLRHPDHSRVVKTVVEGTTKANIGFVTERETIIKLTSGSSEYQQHGCA